MTYLIKDLKEIADVIDTMVMAEVDSLLVGDASHLGQESFEKPRRELRSKVYQCLIEAIRLNGGRVQMEGPEEITDLYESNPER